MLEWKKICCAVDFSDESRFAMEEAAALAARSGGDLTVVHVVGERRLHGSGLPYRSDLSPARSADVAHRLEEWRNAAEHIAQTRVVAALLTGGAVDELLRFAREGDYDLLVIGTPGVLGCERIVFGSVAEGVIRRAPCSVVVARRRAAASRVTRASEPT
jgi:nucleotide-binding universal stress UspA family protein